MHLKERELCFQVLGKGIFDMHVKRTPPLKSGVKVYAIIEESCNNKPYKRRKLKKNKKEKPVRRCLVAYFRNDIFHFGFYD